MPAGRNNVVRSCIASQGVKIIAGPDKYSDFLKQYIRCTHSKAPIIKASANANMKSGWWCWSILGMQENRRKQEQQDDYLFHILNSRQT